MGYFQYFNDYYYIIIALQAICVFHSFRTGNQSRWIWVIIFLPLVGCVAYLFMEVLNRQHVSSIQADVSKLVNPTGKIKELEKKFLFTDTFANRVALADAYIDKALYQKAIDLYEPALKGLFENNEHVIEQLIFAYYKLERFHDAAKLAPRISKKLNFTKTRANLLYALSLEKIGEVSSAESEFKRMNHRFSNYESRYNYGEFLVRSNRIEEADEVFASIVNEGKHMSRKEKGYSKVWIDKANEKRNKITV